MPASPVDDAKSAASAAKGTASAIKGTATTVKAVATIAKAGSGPAGWVMLAKQYAPQIKALVQKLRIAAAAAAALLLYMLWLLLQKIIGMLAGLAFGAISGLPLLLIPGAGPFLYAGWVGFWGYRGMVDPAGTIHLATHPWEAITKPFNWIGDRISGFGSATKGGVEYVGGGISQGAANVFSSVGGFITGAASSIWNGIAGVAGNVIGGASSLLSNGFGLLANAAEASTGGIAAVAVGGTITTVAVGTIVSGMITDAAFMNPEKDIEAPSEFPPGENEVFTVTKTAQPQVFPGNPQPGSQITFTITITPKTESIDNIRLVDNLRFRNGSNPEENLSAPQYQCTNLPLTPTNPCVITFTQPVFLIPDGSIITNTIYAETTVADGSKKTGTATVTVQIGSSSSPGTCPQTWPITGEVTQGPEGATSHHNRVYGGYEALDIGAPVGTPVYSTLDGTINYADDSRGNLDQRMGVKPTGCSNANLKLVHFWHLSAMNFQAGQIIRKGDIIGKSGHVAPHLHYQFNGEPNLATGDRSFPMEPPNIPTSVPRSCDDLYDPCYVPTTAP